MGGIRVSKKLFTSEEIEQLKQNIYVKSVSEKGITYTEEFKNNFIVMNHKGYMPREIFEHYGFDVSVIGMARIASAGKRWRLAYKEEGVLGLQDQRINHSGRPLKRELTADEELNRLKAELLIVKAENELLKKLRYLRKTLE